MSQLSDHIDKTIATLEEQFKVPLASDPDPASTTRLRGQIAQAESHSMEIALLQNQIAIMIPQGKVDALNKLNEDPKIAAMKISEKKMLVQGEISRLTAYEELLDHTAKILERRVSAGQTILNSINTENKTGWAGKNHDVNL